MSRIDRADRRLLRRELHRSRSLPTVIVLVVLAAAAAWLAVECALSLLDRPALLARPGAVVDAVVAALAAPDTVTIAVGVGAALVGLLLLGLALAPGRLPRHRLPDERMLVVADDGVIASALARTARTAAALGPDRSRAWVSRRRAQVRLVPTSGVAVPVGEVQAAVSEQVRVLGIEPPLQVAVAQSAQERVA